jgi:glycosyltransferase involved in cell wall biosynthesis
MRIAIDARLNAYRVGGIPQYTRRLTEALADAAPHDTLVIMQHREHHAPLVTSPNAHRLTLFTPPHHTLEPFVLPLELLRARADIIHFPDFIVPPVCPGRAVTTIHDLAFLRYPEILDDQARAYYGQVRDSAQRAAAVIAVSEATRRDIVEHLGLPAERIDLIYEAAAPNFVPLDIAEDQTRTIGKVHAAAGSFLLFVSTIEPRKNLPVLLQALKICRDRCPARNYQLILAGSQGWRDEAVHTTMRDLRLGDAVSFAGKVSDEQLRWLYCACRLYVNPSRYEGFGLPLLEALACGAACLASNTSSLPEIGGDVPIYLSPDEPDAWADAIASLWGDDDQRAERGRRGIVRAQQFSWQRAARETLAVYRRVAQ